MKLPALQFYPGDWHKDQGVQSLTLEERGAWWEMMLMMHDSEERGVLTVNGSPMPDDVIARRLGLDNQKFNQILGTLLKFGVPSRRSSDGAIFCRRMVADEELRKIRQKAGKLGGNPALLKQNTTTPLKQFPTPSARTPARARPEDESEVQEVKEGEGNHKGINGHFHAAKSSLNSIYQRDDNHAWTYFEDSALSQLLKRPGFSSELSLVLKFRTRLKDKDARFFPNSLARLFEKWSETVDRARAPSSKGMETGL